MRDLRFIRAPSGKVHAQEVDSEKLVCGARYPARFSIVFQKEFADSPCLACARDVAGNGAQELGEDETWAVRSHLAQAQYGIGPRSLRDAWKMADPEERLELMLDESKPFHDILDQMTEMMKEVRESCETLEREFQHNPLMYGRFFADDEPSAHELKEIREEEKDAGASGNET